jgi:adenylate cyclase
VLEGSIRRSSNRIRVTGQLVDTLNGNHIWAERYDRVLEDIFAVQEELTQAIVGAITPQIEAKEEAIARRRRPDNLSAYEVAVRAWAHAWEGQGKTDQLLLHQSIHEAKEALGIDPNCLLALHALAWARGTTLLFDLTEDREHATQEATWAVSRALELDSMDAFGYALRGLGLWQRGELGLFPEALADARHAHEMNPNDTFILRVLSALESAAGDPGRGVEYLRQVMRLSPRDPHSHVNYVTMALVCFTAKQYDEGVRWALRGLADRPQMTTAHLNLAVCLVGAGEFDKARAAFKALESVASPDYVRRRLEAPGRHFRQEDRLRWRMFLRIAAGLEAPSAAEALR